MRLTTQIGQYEMDQVILDLWSDTNFLPKHTWEQMGRPALQWSPIQLRMAKQQKIIPMGQLQGVTVDTKGASMLDEFEVIEIVDDNNPYPVLLGIDWAIDMNGFINLEKHKMIFEKMSLCVVIPLDQAEGACYIEPMRNEGSDDKLDCIYKITARDQDLVNPTAERRISWECRNSCTSDSDGEDKHWYNWLNGVTTLNCNMMTRSLYCVRAQDCELSMYDGLTAVDEFLTKFESAVPEH